MAEDRTHSASVENAFKLERHETYFRIASFIAVALLLGGAAGGYSIYGALDTLTKLNKEVVNLSSKVTEVDIKLNTIDEETEIALQKIQERHSLSEELIREQEIAAINHIAAVSEKKRAEIARDGDVAANSVGERERNATKKIGDKAIESAKAIDGALSELSKFKEDLIELVRAKSDEGVRNALNNMIVTEEKRANQCLSIGILQICFGSASWTPKKFPYRETSLIEFAASFEESPALHTNIRSDQVKSSIAKFYVNTYDISEDKFSYIVLWDGDRFPRKPPPPVTIVYVAIGKPKSY